MSAGYLLANGYRGLAAASRVTRAIASRAASRQIQSGARALAGVAGAASAIRDASGFTYFNRKRKRTSASLSSTGGGGGGGGAGGAGYAGPFRRSGRRRKSVRRKQRKYPVRRRKRSYTKGENWFATRGAISTYEVSGSVVDPDCVYVGHSSLAPQEALRVMVYALTRRLYSIALGFELSNMNEIIPYKTTAGAQNSGGHTITVKYSNNLTNNTKNQDVITIADGQTLVNVGDAILGMFKNVASNSDGWKNARLLWIDVTDTTTGVSRGHLDLTNMTVTFLSKSLLKMQNVTIPVAGASTEDVVNNVPLVGRNYSIKHWAPQPVDQDANGWAAPWENTGVLTLRSAAYTGVQYETWKEPPPSKAFKNCSSSALQRLEPGTIKQDMLVSRCQMSLENFLLALSTSSGFSSLLNKSVRIGSHNLFAFERVLQKAGDLPITVNYEVNFFTACSVYARDRPAIMQKVTFATQSIP